MKECPFCSGEIARRIVGETGTAFAVPDAFPVTEGHTLVIPRRHTPDFFSMTDAERRDMEALLFDCRESLLAADPSITGFNFGMNCGVSAGQTVPHAHLHLIPRRAGDTDRPTGGVRGVIPGKQAY